MVDKKFHLQEQEIPDGYMIFEERLEVAGIQFQKNAAISFSQNTEGCWLELEREEGNKYDKNAIKVIGCRKAFLGNKRYFIGYVPKEISRLIIEGGFLEIVKPRLLKTYVSENDFVEILFQLLGPVGKKYQFKQTEKVKGKHFTDYVDRVKQLIEEKNYPEAIELLLKLVNQTEKEAKKKGLGVAPWYYEQLAVIYRKEKRYNEEVEILERFEKQPKSPGSLPKVLAERLIKARELLNK
jgi:tetratricopeptide (TPR) repeat protein